MMKRQDKAEKPRKTFGLSLNRELMLEIQHLALDQDRYVNETAGRGGAGSAEEVCGEAEIKTGRKPLDLRPANPNGFRADYLVSP
jgi:hypothetical protein